MNQHDSAEYYFKKGNEYFDLGKFQDAIRYFDNVIECFNNVKDLSNLKNFFTDACIKKGDCLNYLGKYQDAIQCANDAFEINENIPIIKLPNFRVSLEICELIRILFNLSKETGNKIIIKDIGSLDEFNIEKILLKAQ